MTGKKKNPDLFDFEMVYDSINKLTKLAVLWIVKVIVQLVLMSLFGQHSALLPGLQGRKLGRRTEQRHHNDPAFNQEDERLPPSAPARRNGFWRLDVRFHKSVDLGWSVYSSPLGRFESVPRVSLVSLSKEDRRVLQLSGGTVKVQRQPGNYRGVFYNSCHVAT